MCGGGLDRQCLRGIATRQKSAPLRGVVTRHSPWGVVEGCRGERWSPSSRRPSRDRRPSRADQHRPLPCRAGTGAARCQGSCGAAGRPGVVGCSGGARRPDPACAARPLRPVRARRARGVVAIEGTWPERSVSCVCWLGTSTQAERSPVIAGLSRDFVEEVRGGVRGTVSERRIRGTHKAAPATLERPGAWPRPNRRSRHAAE